MKLKKSEFNGENNEKLNLTCISLIGQEYKDINKYYRDIIEIKGLKLCMENN